MQSMPVPPNPGEDFDAWMDWWVHDMRRFRRDWPNSGDPDAPRQIIEEAVIQEILRDALFDCYPLMEFCIRKAVERDPDKFGMDYVTMKEGGDASDEFWDAWTIEFTARIHECIVQMRPPYKPKQEEEE